MKLHSHDNSDLANQIKHSIKIAVDKMYEDPSANMLLVLDALNTLKENGEPKSIHAAFRFTLESAIQKGIIAGLKSTL